MGINHLIVNSIFIFVLIFFRTMLKDRISSRIFVWGWLILSIQLVFPYPKILTFSIIDFFQKFSDQTGAINWEFHEEMVIRAKSTYDQLIFYNKIPMGMDIFPVLRVVGMVIFFSMIGMNYRKLYSIGCQSLPLNDEYFTGWERNHSLPFTRYAIRYSDRMAEPLTILGMRRQIILLPKYLVNNVLDTNGMNLVLLHEWIHIRGYDIYKKIIFIIALGIHWFNPLVWLMFYLGNEDLEKSCDEAVIKIIGRNRRNEYINLLLHMELHKVNQFSMGAGLNYGSVTRRVKAMKNRKEKRFTTSVLSILLILFLGIFGCSNVRIKGDYRNVNLRIDREDLEKFAIYEPYGLVYDRKNGRFKYEDKLVRIFIDEMDRDGNLNSFSYLMGDIDVLAQRDRDYKLTGLTVASPEEFERRTKYIKENYKNGNPLENPMKLGGEAKQHENTVDKKSSTPSENSFQSEASDDARGGLENGKDNSAENNLERQEYLKRVESIPQMVEYKGYNIKFSEKEGCWIYQGHRIATINDPRQKFIFQDPLVEDGIEIEVIRNRENQILDFKY
ncbi:MAG: M56 family metallopeptidase [Tissierellia bacterium]|nr:M56 family metallopeptidase [Tissierellia bacterium]